MNFTQLTIDQIKDWLIRYKSLSSYQNKYTVEDYHAACIEYENRIDEMYNKELIEEGEG